MDFSRTKEATLNSDLLCAPLHLVGVEIVITLDHPNLRGEFAVLGLLSNLRCADSRTASELVFDHGLLDSSFAADRDAGTYIATSRAIRMAT